MRKILVIGGAGYIGSVLVHALLDNGYHVRVLDNFTFGDFSLKDVAKNPNIEIMKGDTRHVEHISSAVFGMDAVVHLAELVGDPACGINPKVTYDINYLGTHLISFTCKHYKINRFVYISSCSVYGASGNTTISGEQSPLNPLSLYAKVKIASEKVLLDMTDNMFSPTILRLGTVFGYSYRPRFDLVVNQLISEAIHKKKIIINGGDQWRPHISVTDVARAIICVLNKPVSKIHGEIFNVGSEQLNLTIAMLGKLIKSYLPSTEVIINNSVDNRDYRIDFSKIKQSLGFSTMQTIEDGFKELSAMFENDRIIGHYSDSRYNNFEHLKNKLV